jgi:hypothetical protein
MVLKQASLMKCFCGQEVTFPEGEVRTKCKTKGCRAVWECGVEGFWSVLAPVLPTKLNHYEKYMAWRNKNNRKRRRK